MEPIGWAFVSALLFAGPLAGQSAAELQEVAEGWGRGVWTELRTLGLNPQTGQFEAAKDSPYTRWEVGVVAPATIRYTTAHGAEREVQLVDGLYREADIQPDGTAGPFDEAEIVEHSIHGPDNWRLLIQWPVPQGATAEQRASSEIEMVGDLFIWTQWRGRLDGERSRQVYSVSRLER